LKNNYWVAFILLGFLVADVFLTKSLLAENPLVEQGSSDSLFKNRSPLLKLRREFQAGLGRTKRLETLKNLNKALNLPYKDRQQGFSVESKQDFVSRRRLLLVPIFEKNPHLGPHKASEAKK